MKDYIETDELVVGYNGMPVSTPLSFRVEQNDYLCIVGENGAGKSTLMKTLLGLLKPIDGMIAMDPGIRIGYLPQQTTLQKEFPATVLEIVLTGFLSQKTNLFYTKYEKKRAKDMLTRLGIDYLMNRNFKDLSGGQQQKALMARALVVSSDLLLLDEPVTGLDPTSQEDMYKTIRMLNETGTAVIMISHDKDRILKEAKHILYVNNEPFFGTVEQYQQMLRRKEAC